MRIAAALLARQDVAMDLPAIKGFGHIDLTVTDMDRSVRWWEEVMRFKLIRTRERADFKLCTVIHPSGFFIGLMTHTNATTERFDEHAVGLDHLALRVPDRTALEAWAKCLDDLGIENSGVQDEAAGPLIVFRDPDNIQLELWGSNPNASTRITSCSTPTHDLARGRAQIARQRGSVRSALLGQTLGDFPRSGMHKQFELDVVRISEDHGRTPGRVDDPGVSHTATVEMFHPAL